MKDNEYFFLIIWPEKHIIEDSSNLKDCGIFSLKNFPHIDNKHRINMLSTRAKSFISAYKKLHRVSEKEDFLIVPFPADYDFLRETIWEVRHLNRMGLQMQGVNNVKYNELKKELSRRINDLSALMMADSVSKTLFSSCFIFFASIKPTLNVEVI